MKLHHPDTSGLLSITAYGEDHIAVNGRRLTHSFLLTPRQMVEDWAPDSIDSLDIAAVEAIAALGSPIVLLGTGRRQRFPSPQVLRPLIERQIGVEVMDSFAACRTYNILLAEGRIVTAALILEA